MSGRSAANTFDIQDFDTTMTGGGSAPANGSALILHKALDTTDTSAATVTGRSDTHTICLLAAVCALAIFAIVCLARIRRLKSIIRRLQPESDDNQGAGSPDKESYRPYENRSSEYDRIFLSRLDNLISDNLCNHDMNVDYLAAKMLISRSLLFNRVKRITGKSVVEYINDFRITKAKELLQDEKYNLTEISELVGFSSLRYFSRVFKASVGESPSIYRQQSPPDRQ